MATTECVNLFSIKIVCMEFNSFGIIIFEILENFFFKIHIKVKNKYLYLMQPKNVECKCFKLKFILNKSVSFFSRASEIKKKKNRKNIYTFFYFTQFYKENELRKTNKEQKFLVSLEIFYFLLILTLFNFLTLKIKDLL